MKDACNELRGILRISCSRVRIRVKVRVKVRVGVRVRVRVMARCFVRVRVRVTVRVEGALLPDLTLRFLYHYSDHT